MSITPNANPNEHDTNTAPQQSVSVQAAAGSERQARNMGVLLGILFFVALTEGVYAWWLTGQMNRSEQALVARISTQQDSIDRLNAQLGGATERFTVLEEEINNTKGAIGSAQGEIRRTRQLATQLEKKQKESSEVISSELGKLQEDQVAARGSIGSINNDMSGVKQEVSGVKQEVSLTKDELASTKSQLQRVVGDLGVQSDLIARNHEELGELRARGERDYFEFDLRKANKAQRVGDLGLQLKKVDVKRQKYTVSLVADDRSIEKKDKTVFEPVQFYQAGARQATEIVVNQIYKDRIVGYVSSPKKREARLSSTTPAQAPKSGS